MPGPPLYLYRPLPFHTVGADSISARAPSPLRPTNLRVALLPLRSRRAWNLPGALLFTHHIRQAIESVATTDSVFVFMGATERLRQSLVLPMKR